MKIPRPAAPGPQMQALIAHPTTLRQVGGNPQAARALVELLVAFLRNAADCPHADDEAIAADILGSIKAMERMNALPFPLPPQPTRSNHDPRTGTRSGTDR